MELTKDQLKQLLPKNPYIDQWHGALAQLLPDYGINTPQRIAAFVAQGLNLLSALQFAVYIKGCAADDLVSSYGGYNGILATDVIVNARKILNKILYSS